ncbi:MAG: pseudouridine synthase [Alphaproteobacteria bacterium]|nr:MAG: pseudouridine synthase [Alphaproteobacteria bacterium]
MSEEKHKGERIAKRMARAGLCSRRDAERWIGESRVKVNGKTIDSPALNVTEDDKIIVDGKALPSMEQTRLFLYHKPPGLVTTHRDEQGRSTVFDELPSDMPRVVSVGRLDLSTEGLILLTNDGGLARHLELPDTGWKRKYRVRVNGRVNEKRLQSLKNGITVEGVRYKSIEVTLDVQPDERESAGANSWITMTLREGKNREIRRVLEALGLSVTRLIRTDYGPFSLGKMSRGSVSEVTVGVMRNQIGEYFRENNIKLNKRTDPEKAKRTFRENNKNFKKSSPKSQENRKNTSKNTNFRKKSKKS